jgi:hypothetical protein
VSFASTSPPPEWADRYQRYLSQAAVNATRIRDLYGEIMSRIARGDLSQQAFELEWPAFLQTHGQAYADDLAAVSTSFLTGLIAAGTSSSQELVERVVPDPIIPPPIPSPIFDVADWSSWLAHLADFAARHNSARADLLRQLVEHVSTGDVTPTEVSAAAVRTDGEQLPASARETVRLYFEMLTGLDDVTSEFTARYLAAVLGDDRYDEFVLPLRGVIGGDASVRLAVENNRDAEMAVRCVLTDLRRSDGVGAAFEPTVTFAPERFSLAPAAEQLVTMTVRLHPEHFEPGRHYVGTLHVLAPGDTLLAASVRVEPSARGVDAGDDAARPTTAPRDAS